MRTRLDAIRRFISTAAAIVLGVAGTAFWNVIPCPSLAASGAGLTVSVTDLSKAGFTAPTVQQPVPPSGFIAPNAYFRVNESVASTHPEWGGTANLVAVLIVTADPGWTYNQGGLNVSDIAGRTQIRFSRPGYYVVVTGPDKNKVAALANILLTK